MKKLLSVFVLLFLFSGIGKSQLALTWEKKVTVNSPYEEMPKKIFQADYNNFIVVYTNNGNTALAKYDIDGNQLWRIDYFDSTNYNWVIYRDAFLNSNNTISCISWEMPHTTPNKDSIMIQNIDFNGNILWTKKLGDSLNFRASEQVGNSIAMLTYRNIQNPNVGEIIFYKIDVYGNIILNDTIHTNFSPYTYEKVMKFKDGSYAFHCWGGNDFYKLYNSNDSAISTTISNLETYPIVVDTLDEIWSYYWDFSSQGFIGYKFDKYYNPIFPFPLVINIGGNWLGDAGLKISPKNYLQFFSFPQTTVSYTNSYFSTISPSGQLLSRRYMNVDSLGNIFWDFDYSNGKYYFVGSKTNKVPQSYPDKLYIVSFTDTSDLKIEFCRTQMTGLFTMGKIFGDYLIVANQKLTSNYDKLSICRFDKTDNYKLKIATTVDEDLNCQTDSADYAASILPVIINPGNLISSTNQNGELFYTGDTGVISFNVQMPSYFGSTCQPNPISLYAQNSIQKDTTIYLSAISPQCDLSVLLYQGQLVSGYPSNGYLFIQNEATLPASCWLKLTTDSIFSSITFSQTPDSISSHTYFWHLSAINPFSYHFISYTVNSFSGQFGDTFSLHAIIAEDCTPVSTANDTSNYSGIVISSFDPNEITSVTKEGYDKEILQQSDSSITYIVRFQNTGTAAARNIYVKDTLSNLLDVSSLHHLASNHYCHYTIQNNILTYYFDNIYLPDSGSNLEGSEGFFIYKINFLPAVRMAPGLIIKNSASIYFDFNTPVKTNTVKNYFNFSNLTFADHFYFSPNPASANVLIAWSGHYPINEIKITDLAGKLIQTIKADRYLNFISLSTKNMANGMYLVSAVSENGINISGKFIVSH